MYILTTTEYYNPTNIILTILCRLLLDSVALLIKTHYNYIMSKLTWFEEIVRTESVKRLKIIEEHWMDFFDQKPSVDSMREMAVEDSLEQINDQYKQFTIAQFKKIKHSIV